MSLCGVLSTEASSTRDDSDSNDDMRDIMYRDQR